MKAQTSMEYILILGGALLFVTLVVFMIRGSILNPTMSDLNTSVTNITQGVASLMPT